MTRTSLHPSAPPPAAGALQPAVPTSLWRDMWRLVRTPGSLVADRLLVRSGESRFGLGRGPDDRPHPGGPPGLERRGCVWGLDGVRLNRPARAFRVAGHGCRT